MSSLCVLGGPVNRILPGLALAVGLLAAALAGRPAPAAGLVGESCAFDWEVDEGWADFGPEFGLRGYQVDIQPAWYGAQPAAQVRDGGDYCLLVTYRVYWRAWDGSFTGERTDYRMDFRFTAPQSGGFDAAWLRNQFREKLDSVGFNTEAGNSGINGFLVSYEFGNNDTDPRWGYVVPYFEFGTPEWVVYMAKNGAGVNLVADENTHYTPIQYAVYE